MYPPGATNLGPSGPGLVHDYGAVTAGITTPACRLVSKSARFYNVLLDGTNVGTAAILVNILQLNPQTGLYVLTTFQFYGSTIMFNGQVSVTNGVAFSIPLYGPFEGLQVAVSSWGTGTGTFSACITAL